MSFFSGLDTEAYDRNYTDRDLARRLWKYFEPHQRRLTWVIAFLLIIAAASAAVPLLVSRGVDLLADSSESRWLSVLVALVLLAGIFTWVAGWIRRRLLVRIVGDVIYTIQSDAFAAAAGHDLSFYDEFSSGKIVSRITSDTREFGQLVTLITDLVSQFGQAIILSGVLISISWRLSLYLFGFLPILYLASKGFRALARTVTRRGMRAMANVNAAIKETVSGIAVAKNYRQESTIFAEFDEANQTSFRVNVQRGFVLSLVFPSLNALGGIATAILVYAGGVTAIQGAVTLGAWFLFLMSLDSFFFPVLNLSAFWAQVQSGLSAAERAFALIDAESAILQRANDPLPRLKGDIRFENVCFRYTEQERIFDDFSLHIQPGESVALVGHTGAGKTSIARLIARFYEFQEGRILVDGQDIRAFDLHQYRSQLGIVSQVPFLFSGSMAENICYASATTSMAEVEQVARQIGDGDWLDTLPNGLDTQVGERGGRLSMGQRQLVSLLRVLLRHPAIFILDEATASIDPFTEWQIQQALSLILEKSTSILIAHRLSTVKAADRILVLEDGRIIEEGNHNALMEARGHYAHLYNTYFRHQSLAYAEQSRHAFTPLDPPAAGGSSSLPDVGEGWGGV
ncbi:MAG: ABC transporter ATP-binding protein [Chloroflexi bacterium]|nr:ABC transporter ATP-binding protein [Chloroflexota bacterium]